MDNRCEGTTLLPDLSNTSWTLFTKESSPPITDPRETIDVMDHLDEGLPQHISRNGIIISNPEGTSYGLQVYFRILPLRQGCHPSWDHRRRRRGDHFQRVRIPPNGKSHLRMAGAIFQRLEVPSNNEDHHL